MAVVDIDSNVDSSNNQRRQFDSLHEIVVYIDYTFFEMKNLDCYTSNRSNLDETTKDGQEYWQHIPHALSDHLHSLFSILFFEI